MRLFKKLYSVDQRDIAEAFSKNVDELTLDDFKKIVPKSKWDYDYSNPTNFVLMTEVRGYHQKTLLNRLNCLWVYPVTLLSLPFNWLITGDWGYSNNTRFGKFLGELVGEK